MNKSVHTPLQLGGGVTATICDTDIKCSVRCCPLTDFEAQVAEALRPFPDRPLYRHHAKLVIDQDECWLQPAIGGTWRDKYMLQLHYPVGTLPPPGRYDVGEITSLAGATLAYEFLAVFAANPRRRK